MSALITGATGFLGRETVAALLERDPDLRLLCLIRAKDEIAFERRLARLRSGLPEGVRAHLSGVRGDIERPRLGLPDAAYGALCEQVERVVHIAATTNFDHSLEKARRINVGGTEQALLLCRALRARGRSGRLDYVGTAYVAGDRQGLVREEDLDAGQRFRNTYEQSKFEAEILCRRAAAELPVAIYRPSIIVGDSRTGTTRSYKTIYWPMKVLVRFYGLSRPLLPRLVRLPVCPDCPLDIVPVDFVADAVARLFGSAAAAGRCYHLAAGPDAQTIETLVNLACDHFGVAHLRYLDPEGPVRHVGQAARPLLSMLAPRLVKNAGLMLAYAKRNPLFDVTEARRAGLRSPLIDEYFPRLINYAYGNDFGRQGG